MSKFEIRRNQGGGEQCWCWRLVDGHNHPVVDGNDSFLKKDIRNSIKEIQSLVGETGSQAIEVSADEKEWLLKNRRGETIAIGKINAPNADIQGYLDGLCKEIRNADIVWENEADDPAYQAINDDTTKPQGIPGS